MMKIDELVEKVNERVGMEAKETDEGIVLGTPNNMGIFIIPEDATNFIEIETWATSNRLYWKKPDREYLSALIEEFLHTPIKERFPEKKYRLMAMRYVEGPIAIKQYVTSLQASGDYMTFNFGSKENAGKWADKELRNLSQWFSQEVIDDMKEPVEE